MLRQKLKKKRHKIKNGRKFGVLIGCVNCTSNGGFMKREVDAELFDLLKNTLFALNAIPNQRFRNFSTYDLAAKLTDVLKEAEVWEDISYLIDEDPKQN